MKLAPIKPKQSLGQNFLIDQNIAEKIIRSLSLQPEDCVIEIGSGQGSLTGLILPHVAKLFAVELDQRLIYILENRFGKSGKFQLIHHDFLTLEFGSFLRDGQKVRIVGNIPYHITSAVIFKCFENRHLVSDMTLMVQKEVARRIVSKPGNKEYGILAVMSQVFAHVQILFDVSRFVFSPVPAVDSGVVCWRFENTLAERVNDLTLFTKIVKTGFNQRRKMLRNSLKEFSSVLKDSGLSLEQRPEQLSVDEWIDLSNQIGERLDRGHPQ